jgi:hypothetical protein
VNGVLGIEYISFFQILCIFPTWPVRYALNMLVLAYHVMARGDGGKRIFLDEEDARGFSFAWRKSASVAGGKSMRMS